MAHFVSNKYVCDGKDYNLRIANSLFNSYYKTISLNLTTENLIVSVDKNVKFKS